MGGNGCSALLGPTEGIWGRHGWPPANSRSPGVRALLCMSGGEAFLGKGALYRGHNAKRRERWKGEHQNPSSISGRTWGIAGEFVRGLVLTKL